MAPLLRSGKPLMGYPLETAHEVHLQTTLSQKHSIGSTENLCGTLIAAPEHP